MGIGDTIKNALGSHSTEQKHYNDSNTPGSFPSENIGGQTHHSDGSKYHSPSGTAVGHGGTSSGYGTSGTGTTTGVGGTTQTARDALPGHHGQSGRGTDDRNVFNPADTSRSSNVVNPTSHSGNPLTSGTSGIGGVGDQDRDHHNKLHKRDDPRGYEGTETGARSGFGSSGIPERRPIAGQDSTGYGSGTSGTFDNDGSRGHGVYNGITGAGSREDPLRDHRSGHHNGRDAYDTRTTGTGTGHHDSSSTAKPSLTERVKDVLPGVQSEREKREAGTTGTGVGHHDGRDPYDSRSTGTGIGNHNDKNTYGSSTTGTGIGHHNDRDAYDSRSTGTGLSHRDGRDTYGSNPTTTERVKDVLPGVQSEREKREAGNTGSGIGHRDGRDNYGSSTTGTGIGHHNDRDAYDSRSTGTGVGHNNGRDTYDSSSTDKPSITERVKEALPGVQSEREKREAGTTGSGLGHHNDRDQHNPSHTGTGAGQQDSTYRTHDNGRFSGVDREHIGPSGDQRVHQGGSGIGSGLGAGAAGIAAGQAGQHHSGQHGHQGDLSRSGLESSGQRSYDIQNTPSSGLGGQSIGTAYSSGHGIGNQSIGHDPNRSQAQQSGTGQGLSSHLGPGQSPASSLLSGGDPFGGHPGAQVMHQCHHCGKDNDISSYFKKGAVYRLG